METQEIAFVDQKQAEINNKKKIELIKQINSEITSQSPGHLGEGLQIRYSKLTAENEQSQSNFGSLKNS